MWDSTGLSPLMCLLLGTPSASHSQYLLASVRLAWLAGVGRLPHLPSMCTRGPSRLLGQLDGGPSFAKRARSCKLLHGNAFIHQCRGRLSNQPLSQRGKPRPGKVT